MPKSIISTLTGRMRELKSSLGPKTDSQSSPQHLTSPISRLFNRTKALNRSSTPRNRAQAPGRLNVSAGFRLLNLVGIGSASLLAVILSVLTLAPMFSSMEANAEPQTIGAAATIVPNLSLSAQNVSMVMTPTGSGSIFKTGSIDATVSTNNETGYTLYFSDKDDNTSLSHANLANAAITSTASSLTGTNMLANTWGYTLSNPADEGADEVNNTTNLGLTYNSIPTDYTAIKTRSTQTTPSETAKLTFGVKIDNSIPSGTYSDEILISAIINYSSAGYDQNQLWLNKNGTRITTLQEMTPDVCASVPTPTVTATGSNVPEIPLTDIRDGNRYKVRKLADGNCWMVESLKIAGTDATHPRVLTPADSNVTTDFELPAAVAVGSTANDKTKAYVSNGGVNSIYLYNFYAATAGSGGSISSGNASQDICPKGWHLPNSEGNASWNKLLRVGQGVYEIATDGNAYSTSKVSWGTYAGISTATSNPVGLQLTGHFNGGSLNDTGNGYYWSRTAYSADSAYYLAYGSGGVYPQSGSYKVYGFGVRCVADDKEYLQNWTGCSGLSEGETVALTDRRDGKEYTVTKINHSDSDSLCWMTKNLALGGAAAMSLDSSTTNLPSGTTYTLPASSTSGFSDDNAAENIYVDGTHGGYYTWKAATAGESPSSGNATKDICPKGWRLPTKDEFDSLRTYKNWNDTDAWKNGLFKGQVAGRYNNGSLGNVGTDGFYWSSTAVSDTSAFYSYYNPSTSYISGNNKAKGYPVRCVSRS